MKKHSVSEDIVDTALSLLSNFFALPAICFTLFTEWIARKRQKKDEVNRK